jgi:Chlorophyll A-B binding protein
MSMEDMHKDGQEIGKYGAIWGSNQLKGKSQAEINDIKLKELKNGRLAMLGKCSFQVY